MSRSVTMGWEGLRVVPQIGTSVLRSTDSLLGWTPRPWTGTRVRRTAWLTSALRLRVLCCPLMSSWRGCPAMTGFFKGVKGRSSSRPWRPWGGPRSLRVGLQSWSTVSSGDLQRIQSQRVDISACNQPLGGRTTERHLPQALGYEGPGASDVSGRHQKAPSAPLLPGQGMSQMPRAWSLQVQRLPWGWHVAPSAKPSSPGDATCVLALADAGAVRALGEATRHAPPARGRGSWSTLSSWSSCGRTACLSLCPHTTSTAPRSCLPKPEGKTSSGMRMPRYTPLWISPCKTSLWPPRGALRNTVPCWLPVLASFSSARPSS
ncbi:protein SSUH2 homolog isoform X4 [Mus musculus]|uniref:protein SSUH2 homolog isoform X4 n=1 Tax=Mus musculus TaxID=10090 RepID=UPI0007ECDA9F|nr:protein SSUH2 homolog isoform X4 [Mus musculus]|eukprot:XP_017177076.1 PREDICTED: protein SSUH2 homolog isoform X4 [Mus musculus]